MIKGKINIIKTQNNIKNDFHSDLHKENKRLIISK